jgi:DNA polymerase-3 subunit epsilon
VRVRETESELHALILEAREIKRLLPRYNSAGRDDKASWFIRLDTNESYPVPERVSTNARRRAWFTSGLTGAPGCWTPASRLWAGSSRSRGAPGKEDPASTARWAAARRASGMDERKYRARSWTRSWRCCAARAARST